MSATGTNRILEWSPSEVTGFDAATKRIVSAANLSELATSFGDGPVVAAVSRRSTFIKAVRLPNAAASDIEMILRTQMATMFPVPLSELAYSFRLTEDVNSEGRIAVVAAMRESDLKTLLTDAKAAGFKIERVIPAAFGSMLLTESLGHKDAAVVQDTREGLAIDLLAGGELRYSRVAPMPANPALVDAEVSRSFQAVGLSCAPTLAAGGFPYAEAEFKTATHSLEALATAPLDRIGINLETQEVRDKRQKDQQSKRSRFAMLMCGAALVAALYVYFDWDDEAARVENAEAKWNGRLTKLRGSSKTLEGSLNKLGATAESLKRAFQPAQVPSDIFTTVSNHVPKGLWLTGITFERGKVMFVRGTSSTGEGVTNYLQSLTSEPRLRDVKLVFATNGEIEKTPVVQFSIQALPVGNLPLIEQKKGAKKK